MASKPSVSASKDALAAIFGKDSQKAQVGSQPESGEEPESGVQGKGTVDEPYDQGNAPEQAPISGGSAAFSPNNDVASGQTQAEPNAGPTEEIKSSKSHMESVMGKKAEATPKIVEPEPAPAPEKTAEEPKQEEERKPRKEWPNTRAGQQERSVSPGTLDDGSHATTSADKGEGYKPKGKLGNLAGKVFGH